MIDKEQTKDGGENTQRKKPESEPPRSSFFIIYFLFPSGEARSRTNSAAREKDG